jgi:hypothetical protein
VIDTRERIYDLPVAILDSQDPVEMVLRTPVKLVKRSREGEEIQEVERVLVRYPTLAECSRAHQVVGGDDSRMQIAILAEALVAVNGVELSAAEKATFGKTIFEKMSVTDSTNLSKLLGRYGIDPRVTRTCLECGEEWEDEVNVMGFFGSALR